MRFLVDTHILLWVAGDIALLPDRYRTAIEDARNDVFFSPASLWEVAIKHAKGRPDFRTDPDRLRQRSLEAGYLELPITGLHAITTARLPSIHGDPFDRILIAQAICEGMPFATVDRSIRSYPALNTF